MDRGAWQATVPGVARVRYDLAASYHHYRSWGRYLHQLVWVQ